MRRGADFAAAVRGGVRSARPSLVVHLAPRPGGGPLIGFVVSKAVGGAVVRNLVKRRLRAIAGGRVDSIPADSALVVRALPAAARASFAELEEDLGAALGQAAGRLRGRSGRRRPPAGAPAAVGGRA
jgi:ribonuclease P protein component